MSSRKKKEYILFYFQKLIAVIKCMFMNSKSSIINIHVVCKDTKCWKMYKMEIWYIPEELNRNTESWTKICVHSCVDLFWLVSIPVAETCRFIYKYGFQSDWTEPLHRFHTIATFILPFHSVYICIRYFICTSVTYMSHRCHYWQHRCLR
jgi:hypothetical protein